MAELAHYIKDVSPGLGEYFTEIHEITAAGDYVDIEFNHDFVIQDLILLTTGDIAQDDTFKISLKYPQSQRFGLITTITGTSGSSQGPLAFFLNSTNDDSTTVASGHLGTGKQWYRIAPRTILRVEVSNKVSEQLSIRFNVIGHGA